MSAWIRVLIREAVKVGTGFENKACETCWLEMYVKNLGWHAGFLLEQVIEKSSLIFYRKGKIVRKLVRCSSRVYQKFCLGHAAIKMLIRHSVENAEYVTGCSCMELKGEVRARN